MITKGDAILLITDIQNTGVNCKEALQRAAVEPNVSLETLKFINDHRALDLSNFYEKIRKSYNEHKSKLYKNIVAGIQEDNITEVLTTLNSYTLQCLIFEKSVEDKLMFERFSRLEDVYKCLYYYSKSHDFRPCLEVLKRIRADIKALESIYRV